MFRKIGFFFRVFSQTLIYTRRYLKTKDPAVKLEWAKIMLSCVKVEVHVKGQPKNGLVMVGNHLSYVDIPLLMSLVDCRFIAKSQIRKWPIIGKAVLAAGTVMVDRSDAHSRADGVRKITDVLTKEGSSIVIFPSGTTSIGQEKPWRWGAFEIAKKTNTLIQPFRIKYDPLRPVAFIDDDAMAPHLFRMLSLEKIDAFVEFHEPVPFTNPEEDAKRWHAWTSEWL